MTLTLKKPALACALSALLLATAPQAWAHDNATLDSIKSHNGGQVRAAGEFHLELLLAPPGASAGAAKVVVWVTDHAGTPSAIAGATGVATILSGSKKTVVKLAPQGGRMVGEGSYVSASDTKVIVNLTLPGQPAVSARFTPGSSGSGHAH